MHKTCPVCRKHSDFIVPSNTFYEHSTPEKAAETNKYLAILAKIACRHFTQSPTNARFCPSGNECHYAHTVNGNRYIFTQSELAKIKEREAIQHTVQGMLGELMTESGLGMYENEAFVLEVLNGLVEHDHQHDHHFHNFFDNGGTWEQQTQEQWWTDDGDDDDYDDEYYEDEYYYEDEEYDEEEGDTDFEDDLDELPALIDDELPDLGDSLAGLMDDLPPLVDDDLPNLVDDDLPDLIDLPLVPDPGTRGSTNDQPDKVNHQTRAINDNEVVCNRPDWGPTNAERDISTQPRLVITPRPTIPQNHVSQHQSEPTFSLLQPLVVPPQIPSSPPSPVSPRSFGVTRLPTTPPTPPSYNNTSSVSPTINPLSVPTWHLRRFTPPQHTPPPGPRRPRPPRTLDRDASHPEYTPSDVRPPPPPQDDITWDDDDGMTDGGEISEREKQRIKESEERGINARNWDSRATDLSYFRS